MEGAFHFFFSARNQKNHHNAKLYAVDLWDETYRWQDPQDAQLRAQVPYLYEIYNQVLSSADVREDIIDIKGLSWEMAAHFEDGSVDFVFIDADHSYESVTKDITAWLPKIQKGGIISGHDYNNPCGVARAVDELLPDATIDSNNGVWSSLRS